MPRPLVFVCAGLLLSACDPDPFAAPDSMLNEYVRRVGGVLDVEVQLSPVPVAPELPRRRERTRKLPEFNIGMLDFFGLYGCGLQHVIGERNSSLGRVMHPSTRLEYELRFIRAADDCLREIEREGLLERLGEINALKRASLTNVAWNAVWGSREIEDFFTRSKGALRVGEDRNAIRGMVADLQMMEASVARIVAGDLEVDVKALDAVYQRWQWQPLMGQVVRSGLLLTVRLEDVAALIETHLGDEPLCEKQLRDRRADRMHSLYVSVYAVQVQPYLADVQRVRRELLPPLQALANMGGAGHGEDFDAYVRMVVMEASERSHWHAFDRAIARHARAWQRLFEQCGIQPELVPAGPNGAD